MGRNLILLGAFILHSAIAVSQTVPEHFISGMTWRSVGPFRGGRVSAVSGVIGQPGTFYMGLPMGGVWKTTNAGVTWSPIFDSVKEASSVGALEVAPSDPRVIYVGMGDMIAGGGIAEGNGVYKSTDEGKTWTHLGLTGTKHIPSIVVDPHDPNTVLVAAQGDIRNKSAERGLFRSTDGGKTWAKTLFVDDETGVQRITWAYDNPKVMLATTMHYYNAPGGAGRGFGGNTEGTKLFKSMDEGVTWQEVKGGGLPPLSGRTCVAIAMNTQSQRMFLVGNFGLYRSDDGGTTWRRMDSNDRRVANGQGGYNCGVYVNSKDPDTVYVINTCSYVSRDGGETFTGFKGAPGGDDPQQMWVDPTDGNRLFFGTDQGATVSLDGGSTWSSWYNQPTGQVYHISVDDQFPYWIYATQQDSGCIATSSRGNLGEVTPLDWLPHPGYEFGYIVVDPLNQKVSYAGGPGRGIVKVTYPSGQWINVSPSIDPSLSLRQVGNQPLGFSPKNPHELLAGFQYLMATTDGGVHWTRISPDLGLPKGTQQPDKTGPATSKAGGSPMGNSVADDEGDEDEEPSDQRAPNGGGAIECFSVSAVDGKTIWVGTNNGLVKLTRDHGKVWEDVSIPGLSERADISSIDASHLGVGTAYVAVDTHGIGDYRPHFYRTHDFGKTWTEIDKGLPTDEPSGSFARVVRADTLQEGLIFAGTESSVYVSFNDGDDWQSLASNLPNTSYRDMVVKGNDLVVGTYGRGFWILDDFSPLREVATKIQLGSVHLFKPVDALRIRRNVNGDTPFPPEVPHALNPPDGAVIDYYLPSAARSRVEIQVADAEGRVVRRLSSEPEPGFKEPAPPIPDFWVEVPRPLPTGAGLNRVVWNLRCDSPGALSHSYEINANPGLTPASPEGPLVLPGVYTITLTVDSASYRQTVTVRNDPRSPASESQLRAQYALQLKLYDGARSAIEGYHQSEELHAKLADILDSKPSDEVLKAATEFEAKLTAVRGAPGGGRGFGGGFRRGGAPPAPSFSGVNGALIRQLGSLDSADMAPTQSMKNACASALKELNTVMATWKTVSTKDLDAFNAILTKNNLKPITVTVADSEGNLER